MIKMAHSLIYYLKHYLFVVMYLSNIIFSSINLFFPLYILGFFYPLTCTIIARLVIKMQAFIGLLIKFADTRIYVYQKKDNLIKYQKFEKSIVTIPNHLTEIDSIYLGLLFNKYYPPIQNGTAFAKHSIRFYPFIGWLLLACDIIFVQNNNRQSNVGQYDYIESKLQKNSSVPRQILIFAEGTTFNELTRQLRNQNAANNVPIYHNVLVPRTTGIYLIEKNIQVSDEIYVSMKFINEHNQLVSSKYYDSTFLQLLLGGHKPKQVHLLIDCKKYDQLDINCREKFNDRIFQNFKQIDQNLAESLDEWNQKYHREEITISINDIFWSILLTLHILASFYFVINNGYYQLYFALVSIVYIIMGLLEHSHLPSNKTHQN